MYLTNFYTANTQFAIADYRELYRNDYILWKNWERKRCKVLFILLFKQPCKVSIAEHGHTTTIRCLQYLPFSRQLLSGSSDRKVKLWNRDPNTGQYTCQFTFSGPNAGFKCSKENYLSSEGVVGLDCDGTVIRAGFRNGAVWAWDATKFEPLWNQQLVLIAEGFLFFTSKVPCWNIKDTYFRLYFGTIQFNSGTNKLQL